MGFQADLPYGSQRRNRPKKHGVTVVCSETSATASPESHDLRGSKKTLRGFGTARTIDRQDRGLVRDETWGDFRVDLGPIAGALCGNSAANLQRSLGYAKNGEINSGGGSFQRVDRRDRRVEANIDRYPTSGVGFPFGKDENSGSQGQLLEAVYFAKVERDWAGLGQFSSHAKNPFIPDEASQKGPKGCCRPAWPHVGRQSELVHPGAYGIEDRGSE